MRYLAKFISGDGLTKREFVPRVAPNYFRACYLPSIDTSITEEGFLSNSKVLKREYQLLKEYRVKVDLIYLEYKEVA